MVLLNQKYPGKYRTMMNQNYLKTKLESGGKVIGTWCIIPSPVVTDIICASGLDFIIIDSEHGPIGFETAQEMIIVCESRDVSPIMRVSNVNESEILKALDIGVHGIQIPNIQKTEDILKIIEYSKYPPLGNRGFSPFTRAGNYSLTNAETLTKTANENLLVGINIENKESIENIDQILEIDQLDLVFIGLFDLSKALGIPGQVNDRIVLDYLESLTMKILEAGKYPGTIATSPDKLKYFSSIDIRFILYLVDCEMLKSSYEVISNQFKNLT